MGKSNQQKGGIHHSREENNIKSVCAVIVTYHPQKELIENIRKILEQVSAVFVIDNGSGQAAKELLENLERHDAVSVLYNKENLGIAAALNIGIRRAINEGYVWAATFDQDSQATPDMIATMFQAYELYPQKEKVASLSPRYKDVNTGRIHGSGTTSSPNGAMPYSEVKVVITSGNLIKLSAFESVGSFDEKLFIDYVDTEYCLRCISQGYKILEVRDAVLIHGVGIPSQHKLLGKNLMVSNHSALRRYYFARNAIYTYKRYIFKQPAWVINNAYVLMKMIMALALFESDRKHKLVAILHGLVDGLSGRMGKCTRLDWARLLTATSRHEEH